MLREDCNDLVAEAGFAPRPFDRATHLVALSMSLLETSYPKFVNMSRNNQTYKSERFGGKLRDLRKANELSMKDLAVRLGYTSHGYISEIETGKKQPTVEFVLKISRLFDVSTDCLLKDELDLSVGEGKNSL